jgi:plastocyanin
VTAAAGDASASVSWIAPASDGGSPVTGYTIQSSPADVSAIAVDGATTTATVTGLTNGVTFTFTVIAGNSAGAGPPSDASNAVTPQLGAPPPSSASNEIPAGGGTVSTDPGTGPTASDQVTTAVTVPDGAGGGTVSIAEGIVGEPAPTSYQFVGQQIEITSTAATSANDPLQIVITLDASLIAGYSPDTIQIYRAEGAGAPAEVLNCTSAGRGAPIDPDPCISGRSYVNGTDIQITVLASSASHWNTATAVPTSVRVSNAGYSPGTAAVQQGGNVQWIFQGSRSHTVTDALGLGPQGAPLFDSGSRLTGTFAYGFAAAGSYAYRSTIKRDTMTGTVQVPARSVPAVGDTATTFTIIWSTRSIGGYVFDVEYRFMKAGSKKWTSWAKWKSGVAQPSATFVPSQGAGSYQFRARLRNAATGRQTGFSPEALITVD